MQNMPYRCARLDLLLASYTIGNLCSRSKLLIYSLDTITEWDNDGGNWRRSYGEEQCTALPDRIQYNAMLGRKGIRSTWSNFALYRNSRDHNPVTLRASVYGTTSLPCSCRLVMRGGSWTCRSTRGCMETSSTHLFVHPSFFDPSISRWYLIFVEKRHANARLSMNTIM